MNRTVIVATHDAKVASAADQPDAGMRHASGMTVHIGESLEGIDWYQVKADLAADAFDNGRMPCSRSLACWPVDLMGAEMSVPVLGQLVGNAGLGGGWLAGWS